MPDLGIAEILIPLFASGLGAVGVGAETAAAIAATATPLLVSAGEGALIGAGTSALTGGKPGIGAIEGAVTGGVLSGLGSVIGEAAGPALGVSTDTATTIADTLLGAGIGAGEKAVEHKNPLTGALTGGAQGFATGLAKQLGSSSQVAPASSGGGLSAAGALGAGSAPSDLTSFADTPDPFTLSAAPATAATGGGGTGDLLAQLGRNPIGAETLTPGPVGQIESSLGLTTPSSAAPGPLAPLDRQVAAYGGTTTAPKPDFLSRLSSDPLGTLVDNGKLALAGAGLGYTALKGNKPPQGQEQLQALANSLTKQSQQLTSTALNTALPPEAQAQLEQARSSATAGIRSQFARMGLSGSTMEAQALAGVQQQIAAQGFTIMQQLMQQGMSAAQAADQMLAQIMSSNVSRDNALSSAVGSFAGALAGSK
jgi:hypothetical protein